MNLGPSRVLPHLPWQWLAECGVHSSLLGDRVGVATELLSMGKNSSPSVLYSHK
jgi:hypothetical protein